MYRAGLAKRFDEAVRERVDDEGKSWRIGGDSDGTVNLIYLLDYGDTRWRIGPLVDEGFEEGARALNSRLRVGLVSLRASDNRGDLGDRDLEKRAVRDEESPRDLNS